MVGVVEFPVSVNLAVLVLVRYHRQLEPCIAGRRRRDNVSAALIAAAILASLIAVSFIAVPGIVSAAIASCLFLSIAPDRSGQQRFLRLAGSQYRQCQEYAKISFHSGFQIFPKLLLCRG